MSATLVGGGFLNGTSEMVVTSGLLWTLPPFGICFGLIIGGLLFAPKMRSRRYCTMLDPMQESYGTFVTSLIYLSSLFGDILWSAAILAALGSTLYVITGMSVVLSVIVSAAVAILYTLIGQMISVAYTDIVELFFLAVGLVVVTPFVLTHEEVNSKLADSIANSTVSWLGQLEPATTALWLDLLIAMTLGSIPWQSYFQRVLSVTSVKEARTLSILAGLTALLFAVPPVCLGVVGATVDWVETGLNETVYTHPSLTLPLVIKQFTPPAVSVLGLGAIAAAVMSSTDSAILGSSSMFTHNVYRKLRPHATSLELSLALKICILLIGSISAAVALLSPSNTIAGLFVLAADIVFVAVLPQLICSLYIPISNGYGALTGYVLSLVLRLCTGEEAIGIPVLIAFPGYNPAMGGQLFPFRVFIMLCSVISTVLVSLACQQFLLKLPPRLDVLKCVHPYWVDNSINSLTSGDNGSIALDDVFKKN
ncbi:high affinity choline transporter 1-like [Watersipora subatra]|uniref:high affinity choline transporter 1-like n=1 Tax=Watersipora subatra TaxID=2589382 RepID=UPI00355C69E9